MLFKEFAYMYAVVVMSHRQTFITTVATATDVAAEALMDLINCITALTR